jgi:hypothetical protein
MLQTTLRMNKYSNNRTVSLSCASLCTVIMLTCNKRVQHFMCVVMVSNSEENIENTQKNFSPVRR